MSALYTRAIAVKMIVGLAIAATIALLSGCAPARFLMECARGALGCQ